MMTISVRYSKTENSNIGGIKYHIICVNFVAEDHDMQGIDKTLDCTLNRAGPTVLQTGILVATMVTFIKHCFNLS